MRCSLEKSRQDGMMERCGEREREAFIPKGWH